MDHPGSEYLKTLTRKVAAYRAPASDRFIQIFPGCGGSQTEPAALLSTGDRAAGVEISIFEIGAGGGIGFLVHYLYFENRAEAGG